MYIHIYIYIPFICYINFHEKSPMTLSWRGMAIKVLVVHVDGQRTAVDPVKDWRPHRRRRRVFSHGKVTIFEKMMEIWHPNLTFERLILGDLSVFWYGSTLACHCPCPFCSKTEDPQCHVRIDRWIMLNLDIPSIPESYAEISWRRSPVRNWWFHKSSN